MIEDWWKALSSDPSYLKNGSMNARSPSFSLSLSLLLLFSLDSLFVHESMQGEHLSGLKDEEPPNPSRSRLHANCDIYNTFCLSVRRNSLLRRQFLKSLSSFLLCKISNGEMVNH